MLSQYRLNKLKQEHGEVFYSNIIGYEFVWRQVTRKEFFFIDSIDDDELAEEEKEDILCEYCILYPAELDFSNYPAGVINELAKHILSVSGFYPEEAGEMLDNFRAQMQDIEAQMESIIIMAFPTIDLETIENWPTSKVMKYYSRAEWILTNLQGVPVGQILDQMNQEGLVEGSPDDFPEIFGS